MRKMWKLGVFFAIAMIGTFGTVACMSSPPVKNGAGTPPVILELVGPTILIGGFKEEFTFKFFDPDGDIDHLELTPPSGKIFRISARGVVGKTEGVGIFNFGVYAHAMSRQQGITIVAVDKQGNRSNRTFCSFKIL